MNLASLGRSIWPWCPGGLLVGSAAGLWPLCLVVSVWSAAVSLCGVSWWSPVLPGGRGGPGRSRRGRRFSASRFERFFGLGPGV